jgi:hypothetical protein
MRYVQEGLSCLIAAAENGNLAVVKYLVEVGGKRLLMLADKVCACVCICLFLWHRDTSCCGILCCGDA